MKKFLRSLLFSFLPFLGFSQSTATYDITFTSTWNATEHSNIPANAHWSRLVGAVHKVENTFLEEGELASNGIKDVAELGQNSNFMNEVQNSSNTKEWLNKPLSPYGANGSVTFNDIELTTEHHLITLVCMIAPSPDWFVSINCLNLRNSTNTAWKDSFTIDVFIYDAGTDDGTDYTSANSPNTPTPISKITGYPFFGNKIGTLTVTQKLLSTPKFEANNSTIKIYPNPTKNKTFFIEHSNNQVLNKVEFYDLLGKQLKTVSLNSSSKHKINLNEFSSGIYLAKIYNQNKTVITKKLHLQ